MAIMRDELPNTQVVILSLSSPDLVDGCHTIYSPTLSSALSSAESIAFAA
jgi:hypothetical protein